MKVGAADGLRYWHQPRSSSVESSGVDWITFTCPAEDNPKPLWVLGHDLISAEAAAGNDVKSHRRLGYNGLQSSHVYVGDREDGVIVQCGAHVAAGAWKRFLEIPGRFTRLDLQVTCKYDPPQPRLALDAFNHIPAMPTHRGRPRSVAIRANRGGGDTLYLASRASMACGRHYDKGVEQGIAEPGEQWRWELETKGDQARSTITGMAGTEAPFRFIMSTVWSWFWSWGLKPGFPNRPCP